MRTYEPRHVESQKEWPDPLQSKGFWKVGTVALPVTLLSTCSAAVLVLVFGFLQFFGADQELFVLPFPGTSTIGAIAAAAAWLIVYQCRRRPGRLWPRIWVLALAGLNTSVALLGLAFPGSTSILTLAIAGLGATIALLPRLAKVSPDSVMVQRIAPLGMLIALIVVPSACAARHAIAQKTQVRVDERIRSIRGLAIEVRELTAYGWAQMEDGPDAAKRHAQALAALSVPHGRDEQELWQSAAFLGKEEALFQALEEVTDQVVVGFEPDRVPRVSTLREASIRWNPEAKKWEPSAQFAALSAVTGSYHQELGRLFAELAPETLRTDTARLAEYREHYSGKRRELQTHLAALTGSWTDNWAVFKVPDHESLTGLASAPLREVLKAPFITNSDGILAPGQLWQLTEVSLPAMKRLAQGAPGCEDGESEPVRDDKARHTSGCHCQNFEEGDSAFFRLDCYSYAPRKDSTEAALRVEMRIVYEYPTHIAWTKSWIKPSEIYFQFLIPEGEDNDAFRESVMSDLATAARSFIPASVRLLPKDRGGSVAGGFTMQDGHAVVHVYRPSVMPLTGLTPERNALVVRVVRPGNRAV